MVQYCICYRSGHKWRYGIPYKCVLRNFFLPIIATCLSFALKNKRIIETLQASHFSNIQGTIRRIMDEIVGHGTYCWALTKWIKYHIVSFL